MDSGLLNKYSRKINDHDTDLTVFTKSNPPKMSEVVGGKEYVDQQITLITETGIPKFMCYTLSEEATEEGQTEFPINLETFDILTDTVRVYSGVTRLSPNRDFSVTENSVVLTRGVPLGRTIDIEVLKNVPLGEDGSVSGKVIAPNSIPADRLEGGKLPVQNGGIFTNDDTTEEQKVDARNALKEIGMSTVEYVDNQITLITETGIPKFMCYDIQTEATQEGQTVFPITLDTFDELTDTVRVFSGLLRLSPNRDYTVENNTVVLAEGIPLGRTLDIEVRKNVPMGEDGSVSGKVIAPNTLPADRIDGSVPMRGNLGIADNLGGLYADVNGVLVNQYETKGDFNNRRGVWVHSKSHTGLTGALQFFAIENGVDKLYNIFGEHNTDLLAQQIQSLIEQGVIEVGEKVYTPSNTLIATVLNTEVASTSNAYKYLGKFIPEKSGTIKVVASIAHGASSGASYFFIQSPGLQETVTSSTAVDSSARLFTVLDSLNPGAFISSSAPTPSGLHGIYLSVTKNSYTEYSWIIHVKKGSPVYFINGSTSLSNSNNCNSIKIYADEV